MLTLTHLQFELLVLLLRAKGAYVSNARLRTALGLSPMPNEPDPLDPGGAVRAAILRLRTELMKGGEPDPISTARNKGYAIS